MSLSKLWELVKEGKTGMLQSLGLKESDMTEQLSWTELNGLIRCILEEVCKV